MITLKQIYHRPRNMGWSILNRSGDRAELLYFYKPKMDYLRKLYENEDYIMLSLCLNRLKTRSIYYAKRHLGFAINKELFDMNIKVLRFEGYNKYADILEKNTTEEFFKPIINIDEENK